MCVLAFHDGGRLKSQNIEHLYHLILGCVVVVVAKVEYKMIYAFPKINCNKDIKNLWRNYLLFI